MAEKVTRIRLSKDTTANWKKANPILLDGEIGIEIKTNGDVLMKVGNGFTAWNLLPYANSDGASEVAEARVNENGDEFSSLKERLDDTDNRISEIGSGGSGVGQVDDTASATKHGEIFNSYADDSTLGTIKNKATAMFAHAEGANTQATQFCTHAEGYGTTASGSYSHSEGYSTTASGINSHAEGGNSKAIGGYSHAEGSKTNASGNQAHAEGNTTTATGASSHAEGDTTSAIGNTSHAEGYSTTAEGDYSHAEGVMTYAKGMYSHSEGVGTYANGESQHAQGKYNVQDDSNTYALVIGNGTSNAVRSNGFTVDWNGNIQCGKTDTSGNITTYGTINGVDVTQLSSGGSSGVGQIDSNSTNGTGEIFNWYNDYAWSPINKATGYCSHAEGQSTQATNSCAHAEGGLTIASGFRSHAEGYSTKASGENQHVQGKYNVEDTSNTYATIIGNGSSESARSNAFTVDWNGNIQCGKTDTSGNFTTNGTINGIDIVALAARVAALEGSGS